MAPTSDRVLRTSTLAIWSRLAAVALAVALPLTALTAVTVRELAADARTDAQAEVRALAQLVASRADDYVREQRAVLTVAGRAVRPDDGDQASRDRLLAGIAADLPPYIRNLSVHAPSGANVGSAIPYAPGQARTVVADRRYFTSAIATRRLAIGDPVVSRVSGRRVIGVALPVLDTAGRVELVATATTELDRLLQVLEVGPLPVQAVVTIIDTAGRVVARSADAERWVGRDLRGDPAVRRVLSRRAGAEELRGVDGAARLLAYLPTRDAPWIVYVGVPAAGVASSARERATRAAALGAAALASALLLAAFIARGIARPITRVTADALALGAGASAQRADVASAGPVRALAEGFNRMADALEASGRALAARTDALARTEARYRLLFEENPEPMWVFDVATLCFLAVNEAAVSAYGYPPEEFLALTIADIRPPEDIPLLRAALGQPGLPGPSRTQPGSVFRHRRRDGSILLVDVASHAIDFDGRAARLVLARDVTERSQLEAQLRQAQKMEAVGQLAGGVAHDFNNLLTIILSHAAFAREALADAPALAPVADDIGQVAHAATRATELTRQLLTFARRQMFAPRVLDVNDLTLHVDRMLRRLIGEHIELVTRCAPALWPAEADPAQIEQVLVNLAVNARDAMPDGGTLTIETSNATLGAADVSGPDARPGEYVVLEVRDTGHGIHPEDVGRLFEPFFTTKPPGAGTGLGLAVCYGIAAQHGGHITVESEPGRGATFRVYLPRSTRAAESPADDGAAPTPRGSETVLLVEDEAPVRAIAERALTSRGYTVLVAGDGEAGLRTVVEHDGPIHLLLTDVMMPRLGGRELAERATAARPTLRVLYMSGYTENSLAPDGVLGADVRFLPKPFVPSELLRAVRDVLDG